MLPKFGGKWGTEKECLNTRFPFVRYNVMLIYLLQIISKNNIIM